MSLLSPSPARSGFTAVNGAGLVEPSHRLHDTTLSIESTPIDALSSASANHHHPSLWRPSQPEQLRPDTTGQQVTVPTVQKRKRPEDDPTFGARPSSNVTGGIEPAKRRTLTSDSAIDLQSPQTPSQPQDSSFADESAYLDQYQKKRQPPARWSQAKSSSQPKSEVENQLKASVEHFVRAQQTTEEAKAVASDQAKAATSDLSPLHQAIDSPHLRDLNDATDNLESAGASNERQASEAYIAHRIDEGGHSQHPSDTAPARSASLQRLSLSLEADDLQDSLLADDDPKKRKRVFSNRTKTGCHTCRTRKKKCDEAKPTCQNCARSGHTCQGYGPKQPGSKAYGTQRNAPLQMKAHGLPPKTLTGQNTTDHPENDARPSHWGRAAAEPHTVPHYQVIRQMNLHKPVIPDEWSLSTWTEVDPGATARQQRLPAPNISRLAPMQAQTSKSKEPTPQQRAQREPSSDHRSLPSVYPSQHPLPPHGRSHSQHGTDDQHQYRPPTPPPLQQSLSTPVGHWTQASGPNRYSHQHTHSSATYIPVGLSGIPHHGSPLHYSYTVPDATAEKRKMLSGQPYNNYHDALLINERKSCRAAVERFNKAADHDSGINDDLRSRFFTQILKPCKRPADSRTAPYSRKIGPEGTIEDRTVVESPFKCEYGYNIHIGKDCILESGCFLQDAASIHLGARCVIGHNVKFYTMAPNLDPHIRKGIQGPVTAGAIRIEDDCFIGAEAVIMPFVTVRRGAHVAAGSVVTEVSFSDHFGSDCLVWHLGLTGSCRMSKPAQR